MVACGGDPKGCPVKRHCIYAKPPKRGGPLHFTKLEPGQQAGRNVGDEPGRGARDEKEAGRQGAPGQFVPSNTGVVNHHNPAVLKCGR